jgi:hypothetical protein
MASQLLATSGIESAALLSTLGARHGQTAFSIGLSAEVDVNVAISGAVFVCFLDPQIEGGGFDALRFRIERDGVDILDEHFEDAAAALAFFDDHVLSLGVDPNAGSLRFLLDLSASRQGDGFLTDFLVVGRPMIVPEPSTGALLVLGLGGLATSRRRGHAVFRGRALALPQKRHDRKGLSADHPADLSRFS